MGASRNVGEGSSLAATALGIQNDTLADPFLSICRQMLRNASTRARPGGGGGEGGARSKSCSSMAKRHLKGDVGMEGHGMSVDAEGLQPAPLVWWRHKQQGVQAAWPHQGRIHSSRPVGSCQHLHTCNHLATTYGRLLY